MWTAYYLIKSLRKKKADAPVNPWGAGTLEWTTTSPPPFYNFHNAPTITEGPYEFENLV